MNRDEMIAVYRKLNASKSEIYYATFQKYGFMANVKDVLFEALLCLVTDREFQFKDDVPTIYGTWGDYFEPFFGKSTKSRWSKSLSLFKSGIFALLHKTNGKPLGLRFAITAKYLLNNFHKMVRQKWYLSIQRHPMLPKYRIIHFSVPELGIDGDEWHAFEKFLQFAYALSEETQNWIARRNEPLKIPANYAAVHIRRGEKMFTEEKEYIDTDKYVAELQRVAPDTKNVLLATDDYKAVEEFRQKCPADWNVFTSCTAERKGFFENMFIFGEPRNAKNEALGVLADVELLRNGTVFICSYTSKVAWMVTMLRKRERCYNINGRELTHIYRHYIAPNKSREVASWSDGVSA